MPELKSFPGASLYLNCIRPDHQPGAMQAVPLAAQFLNSLGHRPTPLHSLRNMAARLGIASLHVKDESACLGLSAFKARGAAWAIARACAPAPDGSDLDFPALASALKPDSLCLVTATDGNHGCAVAWMAARLKQPAVIFMPAGAAKARVDAIRRQGAKCIVTDRNYDECVRLAATFAQENNGLAVQDTAWPGYEKIPAWIMEGYATMVDEIATQLDNVLPTHVFLQVGVGSFAASIVRRFLAIAEETGQPAPQFICYEPRNAACLYESLLNGGNFPIRVEGELQTIMAGLACGELSTLAWPILRANVSASASCEDSVALLGMRRFYYPVEGDPQITAGESAAGGMGLLELLIENGALPGLDRNARVLLFVTEGVTDPAKWQELCASPAD